MSLHAEDPMRLDHLLATRAAGANPELDALLRIASDLRARDRDTLNHYIAHFHEVASRSQLASLALSIVALALAHDPAGSSHA